MKRLVVRLVALSLVAVLGMFAIAQAQRMIGADTEETSSAVTSRFSAADDEVTAEDEAPADPLARRTLGIDPRVRVVRDDQAKPAIYRGNSQGGVVLVGNEQNADGVPTAADSNGESKVVTVEAGDANAPPTDATRYSSDIPDANAPGGAAAPRRFGETAAATDATANANRNAIAPGTPSNKYGQQELAPQSPVQEASDAIDAAVAETVGQRGRAATEPKVSSKGLQPREMAPRTLTSQSTAANAAAPKRAAPPAAVAQADDTHAPASAGPAGTGTPGSRDLEGVQTPSLTIEKVVPPEMQVGKTAQFEIRIQNTGRATARDLQVIDQVPQGTRLVNTEPRADLGERGDLVWNLAALDPGATAIVRVELVPLAEGSIGSVARVRFGADVSARTTVTKPQIKIEVAGPENVMVGEEAVLAITVSNPGSGEATGVILEADVPTNLKHPAGTELEFDVGTLKPNESRRLELSFTAAKAGPASPTLIARAAGVPAVEQAAQFEIVAPKLEIGFEGPKRRFLDRKSPYVVTVSNPGTAAAKDVEVVAYLPRGMKFVEANNHGTYDASQHAVYWSLAELPPQRSGDVQLTTVPVEAGEHLLRVEGKAQHGLADQVEETISVEGVAALSFQISDLADPLAVGGQASYEVRVINTGSKSASNVQVVAVLPAEMAAIDATGPTASKLQDKRIVFQPISRLAPKEEKVFKFRAEATAAGDLRVRVQLTSDEITTPITQEESTNVFADQ
jgi:uncharacterized repeat protein (TIGR01451 family)